MYVQSSKTVTHQPPITVKCVRFYISGTGIYGVDETNTHNLRLEVSTALTKRIHIIYLIYMMMVILQKKPMNLSTSTLKRAIKK